MSELSLLNTSRRFKCYIISVRPSLCTNLYHQLFKVEAFRSLEPTRSCLDGEVVAPFFYRVDSVDFCAIPASDL